VAHGDWRAWMTWRRG